MCHYSHFNTEEREISRVLKAQGLSMRAIAKKLVNLHLLSAENLNEILILMANTLHITLINYTLNAVKEEQMKTQMVYLNNFFLKAHRFPKFLMMY